MSTESTFLKLASKQERPNQYRKTAFLASEHAKPFQQEDDSKTSNYLFQARCGVRAVAYDAWKLFLSTFNDEQYRAPERQRYKKRKEDGKLTPRDQKNAPKRIKISPPVPPPDAAPPSSEQVHPAILPSSDVASDATTPPSSVVEPLPAEPAVPSSSSPSAVPPSQEVKSMDSAPVPVCSSSSHSRPVFTIGPREQLSILYINFRSDNMVYSIPLEAFQLAVRVLKDMTKNIPISSQSSWVYWVSVHYYPQTSVVQIISKRDGQMFRVPVHGLMRISRAYNALQAQIGV